MDGFDEKIGINILLKLIIAHNFQNVNCIMIISSAHNYSQPHIFELPLLLVSSTTVINPPDCTPGCYHYILDDPENDKINKSSWIGNCLLQNGHYQFKAIVLLNSKNHIQMYMRKAYALDAIFIYPDHDCYTIAAFNDWEVTQVTVLNQWNTTLEKFLFPMKQRSYFFNNGRKHEHYEQIYFKDHNTAPVYFQFIFDKQNLKACGSDYNILLEFVKLNKFQIINVHIGDDHKAKQIFHHTIGYEHGNTTLFSYPITGIEISFLVPIPRQYKNWLQLLNVFPPILWGCFVVSYVLIALYFWICKWLRQRNAPSMESVFYFFLQQGFSISNISNDFMVRAILGLLLILGLFYSSLFSSGIIQNLIVLSYEKIIKTKSDLINSDVHIPYVTRWSYYLSKEFDYMIHSKVVSQEESKKLDSLRRASVLKRTEYKIYSMIGNNLMPMQDAISHTYTRYEMISNNTAYIHLMPKLNMFILWCKESGLPLRWEWEYTQYIFRFVPLAERVEYRMTFDVDPIKLSMKHLRIAFVCWGLGIILSLVGILCECLNLMRLRIIFYVF